MFITLFTRASCFSTFTEPQMRREEYEITIYTKHIYRVQERKQLKDILEQAKTHRVVELKKKHICMFLPRLPENLFLRQVNVCSSVYLPRRIGLCANCIVYPVQSLKPRDDRHLYSGFGCIYSCPHTLKENNGMGPYLICHDFLHPQPF